MFKTLKDFDFKGKRVLVRLDVNVPFDLKGKIADEFKILESLSTLYFLKYAGASQIIMMTHIGRPKGQVVDSLKTDKIADRFEDLLGDKVLKLDDCIDIEIPKEPTFIMLENLRFHVEEEQNDDAFAKKLASYADIFVSEAFAVSHRDAASLTGVPKYLPACAGFRLEKEIKALDLNNYKPPIVAILGAAKISDKITLISRLLEKVDTLLLGGAIIFTFYKAEGYEVGKSLVDEPSIGLAKELLANKKIVLPTDIVVADHIGMDAKSFTVKYDAIPIDYCGLDVGEETIKKYKDILKSAKTIIWNGPMGKFEIEQFSKGTRSLAKYISNLNASSIVCGGDTANAIRGLGYKKKFTHVSTGGGASLQFLQGDALPGLVALEENAKRF